MSEPVSGEAMRRCAVDAMVVRNAPLCHEHVAIECLVRDFPPSQPGQFLQLACADSADAEARAVEWPADGFPRLLGQEWRERRAYLRRPFSIADRWEAPDGSHLVVISRTVGAGTAWLEHLRAGEALNITGPLGRGFMLPDRALPLLLVGGGVGIPPLLYLARRLHEIGWPDATVIFGSQRRDLFPVPLRGAPPADGQPVACLALPGGAEFPAIVTSDDGSIGLAGRVTAGIERWVGLRGRAGAGALVLACGPEPMLRAVAEQTRRLGLGCQLCIERNMGCGLGTCLSCVVRVRSERGAPGWRWALSCTEGPVFWRDALLD